ncbi:hypothetical protein FALBO_552 [Fusarium albosuccineum]|uniref:Uncharacterized protein n=1 Tax=Fusarium albosuccineum TaxID=1237068 RepID=A0A8H4PI82_9HYPO|nr:hypothetical protein FALBO_552 [Fusarium albosuccineum]
MINTFDRSIKKEADGRSVAFFKPLTEWNRLFEVRLSGPPVGPKVGPSPIDSSKTYLIRSLWPQNERDRVAALRASGQSGVATNESLTPSEKEWLKTHYGGEFKFLQTMGLNIYKDEHREEGRSILRVLMPDDRDPTPSDDETGGFLPEMLAYRQATLGSMKF